MPSNEVRLPVGELTREITMRVNIGGFRGWLIRMRIAILLFRIGAWIMGLGGIHVTDEAMNDEDREQGTGQTRSGN